MPDTGHDTQRALKDDEVGRLYFAKGDWQGAYNRFKDALEAEPLDADAAFGLAEAAAKLKLKDEAMSAYEKYLQLDPDGPKAKASLKALKNLEASSPKQESPK
jgi:tetratricopeptide (TPR) repeat protein